MSDKWQRALAKHYGTPVPSHLKHGLNTFAKKAYGCDCRECLPSGRRNARPGQGKPTRQRQAESRKRLHGKPVPPGTKHGIYTYQVYGCTCDDCKAGKAQHRKNRAEVARLSWYGDWEEREDGMTVVHWPPRAERPWLCPDCDFKAVE